MPIRTALLSLALVGLAAVGLSACSKKGGEGATCAKPADCRYGFRCEDGQCIGGKESACGYLRRCIPKLSFAKQEELFGEGARGIVKRLKESPQEPVCESQLKFIASISRTIDLTRACGPRVTK